MIKQGQLIYVSGAITSATSRELSLFIEARDHFKAQGYNVFIPPEVDNEMVAPIIVNTMNDETAWTSALRRDVSIIARCSGICVLDTYAKSKGALLEIFVAVSLRLEIVTLPYQVDKHAAQVLAHINAVQAELWKYIEFPSYAHHTDLPSTFQGERAR